MKMAKRSPQMRMTMLHRLHLFFAFSQVHQLVRKQEIRQIRRITQRVAAVGVGASSVQFPPVVDDVQAQP